MLNTLFGSVWLITTNAYPDETQISKYIVGGKTMAGIIPIIITFIVAYWFYATAKHAKLQGNELWTWSVVGGLSFFAASKLTMFVTTKLFVISLMQGGETSMPNLLIIGTGCIIGIIFSIFVHAKFLPVFQKK